MFEGLWRPPMLEPAICVELTTLIVETVTDLVTNDRTDAAVVFDHVRIRIEEGWIQYRCREIQTVLDGQIQRINSLRCHPPFGFVYRFPEFRQRPLIIKKTRPLSVSQWIVAQDLQA